MGSLGPVRYRTAIVVLVALLACGGDPPLIVDEARQLWVSTRPETYDMTFRVKCGLCYWSTPGTTVRVGRDSEPKVEATNPSEVTVDVLFDAIEAWLSSGPLDVYEATFDAELGYPTFISIDGDDETSDDEWVFWLVSLEPVDSD